MNKKDLTEADIRTKFITPALVGPGGKRFVASVVLYDGEATVAFGEGLFAVQSRALWETT